MFDSTTVAIDQAKRVFQVAVMDEHGVIRAERRVSRERLPSVVGQWPGATVALEACGGAHHWGRVFQAAGHPVRLLPAHAVAAYATPGRKDDRRDAAAIAEAASRPQVRAIRVKTEAQQDVQSQQRMLGLLTRQRTQTINTVRGLLAEYGIVLPKGASAFQRRYAELADTPAWQALSADLRAQFNALCAHVRDLDARIAAAQARLREAVAADAEARRLTSVPGVGPTIAAATRAAIGDGGQFQTGRGFAAWLGLTPRLHASGTQRRLGRITRRGNAELRTLFVNGAQALLKSIQRKGAGPTDRLRQWAARLVRRKSWTQAVVAVANKLARIVWAVLTSARPYAAAGA